MTVVVVRPMDRTIEGEEPYVLATATDAIVKTHGGRSANREMFRDIVCGVVGRSRVEIATLDDPEVIWGYAVWSDERVLELFYLKLRLWGTDETGYSRTTPLAFDVCHALLGEQRYLRMRRLPLQQRAWGLIHQCGYNPTIQPEGI